ncbi:chymotrypsin B [Trichonephila clavipes]|nr:chymotrypsin B [Trichonephila clavipes]
MPSVLFSPIVMLTTPLQTDSTVLSGQWDTHNRMESQRTFLSSIRCPVSAIEKRTGGDSGGPLFVKQDGKWYGVGVVAGGRGCGALPGIFTRVIKYLPWIERETGDSPPCILEPLKVGELPPVTPNLNDCGIPNEMEIERIAGGSETTPFEFPWMRYRTLNCNKTTMYYSIDMNFFYSKDNLVALHFKYDQARLRFVEWAQNEIAVVPDFHKRILFSDEAHFWLNGYVNKQNCRIWSEANLQVYVETPLHPEKLTVWCALWAGGILLQKR